MSYTSGVYRSNLDLTKCEAVIFTRKTKLQPITLIMNNQQLSVVTEFNYFGVWLDQRLNWHKHFGEAVAKTKRLIFAVNRCTRLKWGLSSEVLRVLWKQAFEPILLYGCTVWSPALRINILVNKLRQVLSLVAHKIIRSLTVSFEASTVLANIVPFELSAKERITLFVLKHIDLVNDNLSNHTVNSLARHSHSEYLKASFTKTNFNPTDYLQSSKQCYQNPIDISYPTPLIKPQEEAIEIAPKHQLHDSISSTFYQIQMAQNDLMA